MGADRYGPDCRRCAGAGWLLTQGPLKEGDHGHESSSAPTASVVCFGYGDVQHGIRSLAPLQSGRVAEVLVQESQKVSKGEVLIRLDDRDARLLVDEVRVAPSLAERQLAEARQGPEQHRSKIQQQQAAIDAVGYRLAAARQMLRKQGLRKSALVSPEELAAAADQVKEVESLQKVEEGRLAELKTFDPLIPVKKADDQVQLARVRLAQAEAVLGRMRTQGPIGGHCSTGLGGTRRSGYQRTQAPVAAILSG